MPTKWVSRSLTRGLRLHFCPLNFPRDSLGMTLNRNKQFLANVVQMNEDDTWQSHHGYRLWSLRAYPFIKPFVNLKSWTPARRSSCMGLTQHPSGHPSKDSLLISLSLFQSVCARTCACVCLCMCIYMCTHMCINLYIICKIICTHIHTYILTIYGLNPG